jgi:hypothetical protein
MEMKNEVGRVAHQALVGGLRNIKGFELVEDRFEPDPSARAFHIDGVMPLQALDV